MKKAVSILLTLALALSAAACQSKEPAPAESSSGPDASSTAPVSTDSFPSAPITFNLTGSAGSGTDVLFRALASSIEETSDAKMVCVTAYWSPSMVATIEAPADGYTICGLPSANICRSLVDTATEDHNYKDMQVLCSVASSDLVIGVLADDERFSDVNDIADLVEWCKANPDEDLLLACGSQSSISMIATCLFLEAAGLQDQITILNSSDDNELITSILGKNVDLFVNGTSGVYNLYLEGNVKFLNVFSSSRLEEKLPDVPTAQESGYDVVVMAFNPIAVHKDTPKELQEILIGMIETACATDSYKEAATLRGYTPVFYDQQTTLDLLDGLVADMESVKGSLGWT